MKVSAIAATSIAALLALTSIEAHAINAQRELQKQGCLKCHAVSRKKDGPSLKEIAAKYKDDSEAMAKLKEHASSSPEIEVNGKKETHKKLELEGADLDEVLTWILTR
ncbi:c-type cytochrome [Aestuariirhabdus litorea]|uniref:Class I cytochrome c n=1 Tax=Aestuariirhabdus litorea TaxID=2528527 RepID=A0A3P3VQ79_9GAMM|nr:c-type cytochrome [Aestuariirhabdus litorea]RRJ82973.1 class I cytochrome c [Aestuariirhabdus litorea]RWW93133.1 c-type cytochrome [Endozoicomonadaceae bacterium GTF-13]